MKPFLLLIIFIFSNLFADSRNCPDNFSPNPQYTGGASQDECYPSEFVYYSSTRQGFYMFLEVVINDFQISSDDWVAAFNGETCVGARQWGSCGGDLACDVPVLGDDFSDFCDGYMNDGDIPVFKIYDTSENTYITATSSEYVPWYSGMTEVVDILYSSLDIEGCTDSFACNYDPYANISDGSCEYCSCEIDSQIVNSWDTDNDGVLDNYNFFEFNGSISSSIFVNDEIIVSQNDMLAAYINGELRGVANPAGPIPFGPYIGEYMFQMMIYSNQASGENINFNYYHSESDRIFCLNESTEFFADMVIGDVSNPFSFIFPDDWLNVEQMPSTFNISSIYPNPFNPSVNITFNVENPSNVVFNFYNVKGSIVDKIDYGFVSSGTFNFTWSPKKLPSGNYFIVMSDGVNFYRDKLTFIK